MIDYEALAREMWRATEGKAVDMPALLAEAMRRGAEDMLFDAAQTDATVRHMIEGLPAAACEPTGAARDLADWSRLPKDIYVIGAQSIDGVVFNVQCCSVPMATVPEVRYQLSDTPDPRDETIRRLREVLQWIVNQRYRGRDTVHAGNAWPMFQKTNEKLIAIFDRALAVLEQKDETR